MILATPVPDAAEPRGARFDWYAATVNASVDNLKLILRAELGGEWAPREGARHGYRNKEVLELPDGSIAATCLHGGNGDLPHVYASSDATEAFVSAVRGNWPDRHKVSRMDAAIDYDDGDGTFFRLLDFVTGIADGTRVDGDERKRASKVVTNQMGDWHHGRAGRTFYLGSFKSAVLLRLYEKGIQLREDAAKRGISRPDVSDNYVRMEVQVRPDGAAKERAATATPFEAFGYAEWSRELLRRVEAANVERVHIRERRLPDHERTMQWMVKQYESHILAEVAAVGGWDNLGEALRRRMETGAGTPADDQETPF